MPGRNPTHPGQGGTKFPVMVAVIIVVVCDLPPEGVGRVAAASGHPKVSADGMMTPV